MTRASRWRLPALLGAGAVVASVCTDAPTEPVIESLKLPADTFVVQFRDTSSVIAPTTLGHLGVALDAAVNWRSANPAVVQVVKQGKGGARLVPKAIGATTVEASVQGHVATATVRVLDTVYSVTVTASDTIVSAGGRLVYTATVLGPPGASTAVTWGVRNGRIAAIEKSLTPNSAQVISLDTGSTDIIATSIIDRSHVASARLKTARPVALFFVRQPPESPTVISANDALTPGPVVSIIDELGNVAPFASGTVTLSLADGAGPAGAQLSGTLVQPVGGAGAQFNDLVLDKPGAGYRLVATAPGFASATSTAFTVASECAGTAYVLTTIVDATLTTSACAGAAGEYYDRYIVTYPSQAYFKVKVQGSSPRRIGLVFSNGTVTRTFTSESLFVVAGSGTYSLRVYSGPGGEVGSYRLTSEIGPTLPNAVCGQVPPPCIQNIQVHTGITFADNLRYSNVNMQCFGGNTTTAMNGYRLHLPANKTATIMASSTVLDPCIQLSDGTVDDNSGGGTAALVRIAAQPVNREFVISVGGKPPLPGTPVFTISITP